MTPCEEKDHKFLPIQWETETLIGLTSNKQVSTVTKISCTICGETRGNKGEKVN